MYIIGSSAFATTGRAVSPRVHTAAGPHDLVRLLSQTNLFQRLLDVELRTVPIVWTRASAIDRSLNSTETTASNPFS
jgi:hypothetical protein